MARLVIRGGRRIGGTFRPSGNKNAALPLLAACLLTDQPVVLRRLPAIRDVEVMLALLAGLGVTIDRRGDTVHCHAACVKRRDPDEKLCREVRGSILLAAPLLARHGRAVLPPPGGDVIGYRRLDSHFQALQMLGATVQAGRAFVLRRRAWQGANILLEEASVTATENAMMAAALAPGKTVLYHAACEPHVQELGRLLRRMGARIHGLGTNRITIFGVESLRGAEHTLDPDYIEAGSLLAAAAATGGELHVAGARASEWWPVVDRGFRKLGIAVQTVPGGLHLSQPQRRTMAGRGGGVISKLEDGVWPAFPSDLMSAAIVMATQCHGSLLFFEKMFESRMYFVDDLIAMGARIVQCDPHRIVVQGPARLRGSTLSSPDIRAGMALVIAALCARGESIIERAEVIDRGYENIAARLRSLGADIERIR